MTAMEPNQQLQTVAAPREENSVLSIIERVAQNPDADLDKLERLLQMQERFMSKQAEMSFNRAMKEAQDQMPAIFRDAENSHTHSRYARLESIDAKIRPIYTSHGFSLSFNSEPLPGSVRVICEVSHIDGHSRKYQLDGGLDTAGAKGTSNKTEIQGMGSTVSYLRRYLTAMIFNLVLTNEDDDGNGGGIDEKQKYNIIGLMAASKANVEVFLRDFMKVERVEDIRRKDYPKAIAALTDKLRKQNANRPQS